MSLTKLMNRKSLFQQSQISYRDVLSKYEQGKRLQQQKFNILTNKNINSQKLIKNSNLIQQDDKAHKVLKQQGSKKKKCSIQKQPSLHMRHKSIQSYLIPYQRQSAPSSPCKNGLLQKESCQISVFQKQLLHLNNKLIQQTMKQTILKELSQYVYEQVSKGEQDHDPKVEEVQRKLISYIDYLVKSNNLIHQQINQSKNHILDIRCQRVVYSSILMRLEKQIKYYENQYQKLILDNLQYVQNVWVLKYKQNQQLLKSINPQDSINQSFYFNSKNNQHQQDNNKNQTISLNDNYQEKAVSSAFIYYTQSRKVIVFPRFKQHHSSSRRNLQTYFQIKSQEFFINQIKRICNFLGIMAQKTNLNKKTFINNSLNSSIRHIDNKTSRSYIKTSKSRIHTSRHESQNDMEPLLTNTNRMTNKVQIIKQMVSCVPKQNIQLFNKIQEIDTQIHQYLQKIKKQKMQTKCILNSIFSNPNAQLCLNLQFEQDSDQNAQTDQQILETIRQLLKIDQNCLSKQTFLSKIDKIQNQYLSKRTQKFNQQQSITHSQTNTQHKQNNLLHGTQQKINNTYVKQNHNKFIGKKLNKSILSIENGRQPQKNSKQLQKNSIQLQKNKSQIQKHNKLYQNKIKDKQDHMNIDCILKNVEVFSSYQRAFSRMDFQIDYQNSKIKRDKLNFKKDGLVSLSLIKKQKQKLNKIPLLK